MKTCSVEGCPDAAIVRGWCAKHYTRWKRTGDPTATRRRGKRPADPRVRFERLVEKDGAVAVEALGQCWIWKGCTAAGGYGAFWMPPHSISAHRAAYLIYVGAVPPGFDLDHLCRVHSCVNPSHLEPVTRRENLLRGETVTARNAAKTHCHAGHPFDVANTETVFTRRGTPTRRCITCRREWAAARYRTNKEG